MKFIKFLVIVLILLGGLGYGTYHFGINAVSNKVSDVITTEIEDDEKLQAVKEAVNSNPEIKKFIDEGAHVDESNLPFTTKEEAVKTIIQNIGISELQNMQSRFQNGMTQTDIEELLREMEGKLTEEEVLALKAIAYKELYK